MHVCLPFHHGSYVGGTFTEQVFKLCLCNQTSEIVLYVLSQML